MGRRKRMEDDEFLSRVRDVVMKEGVGVSSRRIAEAIGMSSSVLFQRFGSKENLVFAAMVPPLPDLEALLNTNAPDARTHLEHVTIGLLDYFRELVQVLAPLAGHPSFHYPELRKRHHGSPLETLIHSLLATFEARAREGEIQGDIGGLVLCLIGMTHSIAMFEHMGVHGGTFDRALVARVVDVLWDGVAPRRAMKKRRR